MLDEARAESFEGHLQRATDAVRAVEQKLETMQVDLKHAEAEAHQWRVEAVDYLGCYLDEDAEEDEWWPEAILARRVVKQQLWYRVKWRGRNVVTWEKDADIENRKAVDEFERQLKWRSEMPPTAARRFCPAVYVPKRRREAAEAAAAAAAAAGQGVPVAVTPQQSQWYTPSVGPAAQRLRAGETAIWSCEVEPNIWIPYDDNTQHVIEQAYQRRATSTIVTIAGYGNATIDIARSVQILGATRRVQRTVRRSDEDERRALEQMSIGELRNYIGSIVEFTSVHYEALSRLSEADKVPVHASTAALDAALVKLTFEQIMERICEGFEFPGLTNECYICLEDYEGSAAMGVLQTCGHVFHHKCVLEYLGKYSKLCPVCKQPVC